MQPSGGVRGCSARVPAAAGRPRNRRHPVEESCLRRVPVVVGHVLDDPVVERTVLRIGLLFFDEDYLDTRVHEENPEHDVHPGEAVHEEFLNHKEGHAKDDCPDNAPEQRLVLLAVRRLEHHEDAPEDEEVVNRQHPLQEVACGPVKCVLGAAAEEDVGAEKAGGEQPEKGEEKSPVEGELLLAPVQHEVVKQDEDDECDKEHDPLV
mmetsp:Transcript_67303/g.208114  ORF Transcript_67303/g.208114 Transcript_67303/m.208114 type:complete len:207 (-) Transcript_67303:218-838(-)